MGVSVVRALLAIALAVWPIAARASDGDRHAPGAVLYVADETQDQAVRTDPGAVLYLSGGRDRRGLATQWATCTPKLGHPHWSREGHTVVFKTWITCVGNMASIQVRVSTLMGRMRKTGMVLVAGGREDRKILVDGRPSKPFYCPKTTARKVGVTGTYRGEATLEIIEPGGVKTAPAYEQTPFVPVRVP